MPEHRFVDSPLLAAPQHLDRPAVIGTSDTWSWRQIHEASLALSRRLGDATAVCNLCQSRVGFLITCLAAWRARRLLVLPPSAANADIAAVLGASARTLVVGDLDAWAGPWRSDPTYVSLAPQWPPASCRDDELAWQPVWDEVAVRFYTSGSTGAPEPHSKTLRHLAAGALGLGARLDSELDGGAGAIEAIVCSVPQQHMFGFECSLMLPLVQAIPVLDRRPLLPADVVAAFTAKPGAAWIATPLHLRSLVQAIDAGLRCSVVVTSTMPLSEAIARRGEQLCAAPVLEIYGSTETGALALRRTARESRWRPLDEVRLAYGGGGVVAVGAHFPGPIALPDALRIDAEGSFVLLGRHADLVKIAGRRASLSGLNLLLQELPGLEDGVFYLPSGSGPVDRLCLIHSGLPLDRATTLRWLRERLDPVFLPRHFIRLERLPRSDSGKLPREALDQAFARWLAAGQPQDERVAQQPTVGPAVRGRGHAQS